jgi:hypothetical protein
VFSHKAAYLGIGEYERLESFGQATTCAGFEKNKAATGQEDMADNEDHPRFFRPAFL